MEALQLRLEQESVTMAAAEGLTPEQRLLAYETELTRKIKSLTEIQKDVRSELKEWHKENVLDPATGEIKENAPALRVGPIQYAPTSTANWTYDVPAFMKKFGKKSHRFLEVSGTRITAAIKAKEFTEQDLADVRTNNPTVRHGIKSVDPDAGK